MRFLGIGDTCDLNSLYLRLAADGHAVKVSITEPLCHGVLAGMVPRTNDWEAELSWIREAGDDGIILFENVAKDRGGLQDALRRDGFHVVGGSAYGDRLEKDRGYAQSILVQIGLPIARVATFENLESASAYLDAHPGRHVLKFNGDGYGAADTYIGRLHDNRDVKAVLAAKLRAQEGADVSFVLMEHVQGIEMGVGAYFDGERFLEPACLDWEHKHFFPGDLGELTGEMGTVVTYSGTQPFFERTLKRMAPLLRAGGYCGYINLNTILNKEGIWPLEFTCRFGYPGFAILDPLQETSWADLFKAMVTRSRVPFATRPGFAVGVVMTTRPFPYIRTYVPEPIGLPILFEGEISAEDRRHLHYGEVGLVDSQLVTAGYHGWTLVVTGTGPTVSVAQEAAYGLADRVVVPNIRYRRDIGDKLASGRLDVLRSLGWLDERA